MMDKQAALAEAYRRGILPPQMKAAYEEAQRRGLIGGQPKQEEAKEQATQQPKTDISKTESFLRGAAQGATFGLSDEIAAGIKSGSRAVSRGIEGLVYGDNYLPETSYSKEAAKFRAQEEAAKEANPKSYLGGEIAGSVASGIGFGATKAGSKIASELAKGTVGQQAAKMAATGAASAAAYRAGQAEEGERLEAAKDFSPFDLAGGVAPYATRAFKKALGFLPKSPTSETISKAANQAYRKAERVGGVLSEDFTNKFVETIQNMKPQTDIGLTIGGEDALTSLAQRAKGIVGKKMTLEAAQELDESLGNLIDKYTEVGRLTKEGKKLYDVQTAFRKMIEDIDPKDVIGGKEGFEALKRGRKLWSRAAKLRDIEKIITRAEMMEQPATGIKSGFRTLYNNKDRMRGFTKEEARLIKKATETGIVPDALRLWGSRLNPIIAASTGGGLGASTAALAGSMASRNAATAMQVGKAQSLADLVARNALGTPNVQPGRTLPPIATSLGLGAYASSERGKDKNETAALIKAARNK